MKRINQIIIAGFTLYSFSAFAVNWIITGGTDTALMYYDSESMVKNSGIVTVWKKMNVIEKNGSKYSWVYQDEIDCKQKISRTIANIKYTELDGGGRIVPTSKPDEKWEPNAPGTVGDIALKDICKAAEKIPDQASWATKIKNVFK